MIDRLLIYAPIISVDLQQQERLKDLRQGLIRWAEPSDGSVHTALLRFFQAFDKDHDGVLSIPETVKGLRQIQQRNSDGLYASFFGSWDGDDHDGLSELAELLDTNSTGTLSFLELARGLGDTLRVQVSTAAVPQRVATAILEHREALLRACRSLDVDGTG
eukprot:CAMPEP_0114687926 /NCGR_PEP_ID=MMETSP0191-20121206/62983_1 /TAXON_ID=126664 /ORGANISM="Sorites sp." /LENGTH=160 /DNA_ID=CAMNT_0001974931 /DNA_START=105 /DNA_END=583 /DNA_ORIENTATION=+